RAPAVHRASIRLVHPQQGQASTSVPSVEMGLWDVSVRLGAEIAGLESACVRSKLGPNAMMPEAGYAEPPEYRARGLMLFKLEASTPQDAGSLALARVRAAAADCNLHLVPEVRSV